MNMLLRRECPCMSQINAMGRSLASDATMRLASKTVGLRNFEGVFHLRLRSQPASEQRELPHITPSGLSIGTILNTKYYRSTWASTLSLSRKSTSPRITHEEFDSLGCTRLDINTPRFYCLSSRDVIVSISQLFPAIVLHKIERYKKKPTRGNPSQRSISSSKSEYVYG